MWLLMFKQTNQTKELYFLGDYIIICLPSFLQTFGILKYVIFSVSNK
jgi:hypothetical protein